LNPSNVNVLLAGRNVIVSRLATLVKQAAGRGTQKKSKVATISAQRNNAKWASSDSATHKELALKYKL
jgi:hypothetical protein